MSGGTMSRILWLIAVTLSLPAVDLTGDGVLGNSGEQGATLVRGGTTSTRGLGLAVDQAGFIWDRLGAGVLIRCAADGRQVGRFVLPPREPTNADRIAIANGQVVLLLRGELWTLPVTAANGSAATSLKIQADALDAQARDGRVLIGDQRQLAWLDPRSGVSEAVGPGFTDLTDLTHAADGTLYAVAKGKLHAVQAGQELVAGWPKDSLGEHPQLIEKAWYAHAWHSTIKRYDAQFAPAPGVVLGGNSGSFIGHVAENPDLENGRGLVHLGSGEWAVGHLNGGLSLMAWDAGKRQFSITRRIAATTDVTALGVDSQGRVTLGRGWWAWNDTPDAPMREGPGVSGGRLFQLAALTDGRFASFALQYGNQPRLAAGTPMAWRFTAAQEQKMAVAKNTTGVVALSSNDGISLIGVTADGIASGVTIDREGRLKSQLGALSLSLSGPPLKSWTSLASDGQGNLLAAADGCIVVLAPIAGGFSEIRRWRSWGSAASDSFGSAVWIHADSGHLWVADNTRQRVLCFDVNSTQVLACFGSLDQAGDDLTHVDGPRLLAANGERCVVHDAGNQRLIKLLLH